MKAKKSTPDANKRQFFTRCSSTDELKSDDYNVRHNIASPSTQIKEDTRRRMSGRRLNS